MCVYVCICVELRGWLPTFMNLYRDHLLNICNIPEIISSSDRNSVAGKTPGLQSSQWSSLPSNWSLVDRCPVSAYGGCYQQALVVGLIWAKTPKRLQRGHGPIQIQSGTTLTPFFEMLQGEVTFTERRLRESESSPLPSAASSESLVTF